MNKGVMFFIKDNYPKSKNEALSMAKNLGADSILTVTDKRKAMGRAPNGLWDVSIPFKEKNIISFLEYEENNGRKVVVWSELEEIKVKLDNIKTKNNSDIEIEIEDEFLCHSTPRDNIYAILESGYLKSYNKLAEEGEKTESIRGILGEPNDFYDYVDFGSINGYASEIVVASREFGGIKEDIDFKYNPGARIYFQCEKLKSIEGFCQDGIHIARVKNQVELKEACLIVIPFEEEFNGEILRRNFILDDGIRNKIVFIGNKEKWTPKEFIYDANNILKGRGLDYERER